MIAALAICRRWIGLAALLAASLVGAAPIDDRRDELKALRDQIRSLQQDISQAEEVREDVSDELAGVARDISASRRRLRDIQNTRAQIEAEIARLSAEHKQVQGEVEAQRKNLGSTLYRIYVEGGQAGARRMLGGDDPNQLARDAYYLEQIARQRAEAIEEARVTLNTLQALLTQAESRRTDVARLEAERVLAQKKLLDQRAEQNTLLAATAERLRAQRREIKSLQRDEARLEKLLQGLTRIARSTPPVRPRSAPGASAPAASPRATRPAQIAQQVEPVAGAPTAAAFAELRGKLRWPTRGELVGRFGAQRSDAGDTWRGVFIRAQEGGEVRAVADGRIAYADWLRGFGNLIIVDHGGAYMTVYGNNEALYKSPGDAVKQGDAIGSVGATGGAEESGVYFEIRHRGQAQDPVRWIGR